MDVKKIGEKIYFFRKVCGLTQKQLADISGIDPSTISELENGNRPSFHISTIKEISKALNIEWETLLKEEILTDEIKGNTPEYIFEKDEKITMGLKGLFADKKTMYLMTITEEEIKRMKGARFRHTNNPTKQDYIDLLFIYRSVGE